MRLVDELHGHAGPGWRPLIDGALRDRAAEAIEAVADALAEPASAAGDPTLSQGDAGIALFFSYLAEAYGDDRYWDMAAQHLRKAILAMSQDRMSPSLFTGFTGIAWAMAHLRGRLPDAGRDRLARIDDALIRHLGHSPWIRNYDLIQGLVGIGVYSLERFPRPTGEALITRVLDRLEETAEIRPDGITWISRNDWISERWRDPYPVRYYNLGVAHGVPGVIGFLGATCAAGIETQRASDLLAAAVAWLLAQKLDEEQVFFRSWQVPGRETKPARSAWCYGDPGIALTLMIAARGARVPVWEREAMSIARRAATRPAKDTGVIDTTLCHGTVALAHLFNRMYHLTEDPSLRRVSTLWVERTLEMRTHQKGVAGFAARLMQDPATASWQAAPGFITGAAGTALALLAATTSVEPSWDRVLLMSLPFERLRDPPQTEKSNPLGMSGTRQASGGQVGQDVREPDSDSPTRGGDGYR